MRFSKYYPLIKISFCRWRIHRNASQKKGDHRKDGNNKTEKPVSLAGYCVAGKEYLVATDRHDLTAEQIARIYKLRWSIEISFGWRQNCVQYLTAWLALINWITSRVNLPPYRQIRELKNPTFAGLS